MGNMLLSQQPPAGTSSCPHSRCVQHSVNSRPTAFPEFPSLFMPSFSLSICRMLRNLHIRGTLILNTSLQCIYFFIQSGPQMCMLMSAVPRVLEKLIEPLTPLQEMRCASTSFKAQSSPTPVERCYALAFLYFAMFVGKPSLQALAIWQRLLIKSFCMPHGTAVGRSKAVTNTPD